MKEKDNQLAPIEEKDDLELLINSFRPLASFTQFLTGVGVTLRDNPTELIKSYGAVLASVFTNEAYDELAEHIKYYKDKVPFKKKISSKKVKSILYELLKIIDTESGDEDKIQAMRSIFFHSIAQTATEQDEIEAYQLTQLCKQLNSGEILLLQTFYAIYEGKNPPEIKIQRQGYNYENWVNIAAKHQGHNLSELVRNNAEKLLDLNILNKDLLTNTATHFGSPITQLGFRLCKLINEYPKINLERSK